MSWKTRQKNTFIPHLYQRIIMKNMYNYSAESTTLQTNSKASFN